MDVTTTVALIVAIVGAATGATGTFISLRKQKADENTSVLAAYRQFIDPLRAELDQLRIEVDEQHEQLLRHRERIKHLEDENGRLYAGVRLLIDQLVANRITPVWTPEEYGSENFPRSEENHGTRRHWPPGQSTSKRCNPLHSLTFS